MHTNRQTQIREKQQSLAATNNYGLRGRSEAMGAPTAEENSGVDDEEADGDEGGADDIGDDVSDGKTVKNNPAQKVTLRAHQTHHQASSREKAHETLVDDICKSAETKLKTLGGPIDMLIFSSDRLSSSAICSTDGMANLACSQQFREALVLWGFSPAQLIPATDEAIHPLSFLPFNGMYLLCNSTVSVGHEEKRES